MAALRAARRRSAASRQQVNRRSLLAWYWRHACPGSIGAAQNGKGGSIDQDYLKLF
jgi:hypothetical protein